VVKPHLHPHIKRVLGPGISELLYEIAPFVEPRLDVFETENYFYVTVDLAGAERKDFSLRLEKNTLIIEGAIHNSFSPNIMKTIVSERFYGPFKREIPLKKDYRLDKLTAEFAKGILIVSIPIDKKGEGK